MICQLFLKDQFSLIFHPFPCTVNSRRKNSALIWNLWSALHKVIKYIKVNYLTLYTAIISIRETHL